jgi:hypothetical protein
LPLTSETLPLIYEMRTYTLRPGTLAETERRFEAKYAARRELSPMSGLWHTTVGPLHQITQLWPYESLAERERLRAEAVRTKIWPPDIAEFVLVQRNDIIVPFDFSPQLEPGSHGPLYELHMYWIVPSASLKVMERWAERIDRGDPISHLLLAGRVEIGEPNLHVTIWVYRDFEDRESRLGSRMPVLDDLILRAETRLLMPATCSPAA